MREKIYKWSNWQGINLQYIQTAHADQFQKNKQPNQKMAEDLNRHFSKADIQKAKRYMKVCSTSLIFIEMQIKTTMRYYFMLFWMAIIKKLHTLERVWRKQTLLQTTVVYNRQNVKSNHCIFTEEQPKGGRIGKACNS